MKTVFFGASHYVLPVLKVLKDNFGLELIITTEKNLHEPVIKFALENNIPYFSVSSKTELEKIVNSSPRFGEAGKSSIVNNAVGIVADFGVIIPKNVLDKFENRVLNIHPSLLPKYRGSTPVQTAILSGETITGVTIIKLDAQMDHGPILAQIEEKIKENDTSQSLLDTLFRKGAELLTSNLNAYLNNEIKLKEQNHADATFTKMLKKDDGYIDLSSLKIENWKLKIERMTRAFFPWPGVWTHLCLSSDGQAKIIKFLPDRRIQVEGKREMSYKDFFNGYPNADKKFIEILKGFSQ